MNLSQTPILQMDEQTAQSKQLMSSNNGLFGVIATSMALSFALLFYIAYFYGSVQTAGDILITPKNYYQVELRNADPLTNETLTYYVDKIVLIDHQNPASSKEKTILEPAYIKIFETLKDDNLAVLKKQTKANNPRLSLVLQLKPDGISAIPHEPLILQQVDFYADDQPYRISGRRDKKESDKSYYFLHKGICKDISYLLQLI